LSEEVVTWTLSPARDDLATKGHRAKLATHSIAANPDLVFFPSAFFAVRRAVRVAQTCGRRQGPAAAQPMPPPSRLPADSLGLSLLLAARVIAAVRAGQSLTQALRPLSDAAPAARAAAQDVAYGTLRRYGCGEFILARLLTKPLSHTETEALLLAALFRLHTRPEAPYMVVDQAVAAAGEMAGGVFKGLVNGVLRSYLRQRESLEAAMAADDEAHNNTPRWWLARLRRAYPEHWQEIVAAGNGPPPMTLRVNRRRATSEDYAARLQEADLRQAGGGERAAPGEAGNRSMPAGFCRWAGVDPGCRRATRCPTAAARCRRAHPRRLRGAWGQDRTSAGSGRYRPAGTRYRRHAHPAHRGQPAPPRSVGEVGVADCRASGEWWDGQPFDAILADVPCSASGVVRRHPDIKYLRRESDIRRFVHLQADLLDHLWPLLKPGGRLLYATCSVFPEENGAQIDAFLVRQPTARLDSRRDFCRGRNMTDSIMPVAESSLVRSLSAAAVASSARRQPTSVSATRNCRPATTVMCCRPTSPSISTPGSKKSSPGALPSISWSTSN
jgi:16S rRNA (cytosine967-C5)-methyltransferase